MSQLVYPTLPGLDIAVERTPIDDTAVVKSLGNKEFRTTWSTAPRYRYRLTYNLLRSDVNVEFQRFYSFFSKHRGQLDSFLFVDPEDNTVTDHGFGVGDGATTIFQLQRTLSSLEDDHLGSYDNTTKPRTNKVIQSQAQATSPWTATNLAIATAGGPDGTADAKTLTDNNTNGEHRVTQTITVDTTRPWTYSVYVKAGGTIPHILLWASSTEFAYFDIGSTAVTVNSTAGGSTATVTAVASAVPWYRCTLTFTPSGASKEFRIYLIQSVGTTSYVGTVQSVAVFGAQAEPGSVATQYIVTGSTVVTSNPLYYPQVGDGFEPVYEPSGPYTITVDGTVKAISTDYTPTAPGRVTFSSAPASGAVLARTGNYRRRVRFAVNEMSGTRIVQQWWEAKQVDLISVVP